MRSATLNDRKAVGYVRVSTDQQASEGVSLEAQHEKIEAYAKLAGLELVAVAREEGVSAALPLAERPEGARVVEMLTSGAALHVISLKLDRLFRSAIDALTVTSEWDRRGIALHVVEMGGAAVDTSSAVGRMFLTMVAGFAEMERRLIGERTSTALQSMKARREVYGAIPYGFEEVRGVLVEVPEELAVVEKISAMRVAGVGLREIGRRLDREGVRPRSGGRWALSTIQGILANDIYATASPVVV